MNVQSSFGAAAIRFAIPESRWSDSEAAGKWPEELLLYRSNLLGSDLTVTNFGGGHLAKQSSTPDSSDPMRDAVGSGDWHALHDRTCPFSGQASWQDRRVADQAQPHLVLPGNPIAPPRAPI